MAPKKSTAWMDDHDDAHFDGNPAYKRPHTKKHVVGKIRTGAGASGRTGKYVGTKNRTVKKRMAGK